MNGKAKGSAFERVICKKLSLWVTDGERQDVFWRSAMSGGRATVANRLQNGIMVRQAGDICAVGPEGHAFVTAWYVECKAYRTLNIDCFVLKGTGNLARFWKVTCREAHKYGRSPMLIARQNMMPVIVVSQHKHLRDWAEPAAECESMDCDITLFDSLVEEPFER